MGERLYVCRSLPHRGGGYEVRSQDRKVKLYGPPGWPVVEGDMCLSVHKTREDADAAVRRLQEDCV